MRNVLVTGGAGFHRLRGLPPSRRRRRQRAERRQAHLRRQPEVAVDDRQRARTTVSPGSTSATGRAIAEAPAGFQPDHVIHLAAESHVDRSITGSDAFVQTNILGTFSMLEAARAYWLGLAGDKRDGFRFLHVSTDEVYGSLGRRRPVRRDDALRPEFALFGLEGRLRPPGAAWAHTYGLPARDLELLQQLRPVSVSRKADPAGHPQRARGQAAAGLRRGRQRARLALRRGPRAALATSSTARPDRRELQCRRRNERQNIDVVRRICALLDRLRPAGASARADADRLRHRPAGPRPALRHRRDQARARARLAARSETFDTGIEKTVRWYLDNEWWWRPLREKVYAAASASPGFNARRPARTSAPARSED